MKILRFSQIVSTLTMTKELSDFEVLPRKAHKCVPIQETFPLCFFKGHIKLNSDLSM